MTTQQVEAVMLELRSGVIPQDLPDETLKTMSLHVRPLPFERTLAAVRRYVATPNLDGRPKFVSSVDELLTACEIPTKARGLVTLAAYDGGECWPDLRETSGWSYVARGAEPPQGVLEYRAVSAGALAEPERPALPAGGGAPAAVLTEVARRFREQKTVDAALSSAERIKRADLAALPPAARPAVARMQALVKERESLNAGLQEEYERLAEIRAEAAAALVGGELEDGAVQDALAGLVARLAVRPGGLAAVAEAVAQGLTRTRFAGWTAKPTFQPDDEEPTLVRITLRKEAA